MTRADEIVEFMVTTMQAEGFDSEDPDLRLAFLSGLRDVWKEDKESSFEKSLYQAALSGLIAIETLRVNFRTSRW